MSSWHEFVDAQFMVGSRYYTVGPFSSEAEAKEYVDNNAMIRQYHDGYAHRRNPDAFLTEIEKEHETHGRRWIGTITAWKGLYGFAVDQQGQSWFVGISDVDDRRPVAPGTPITFIGNPSELSSGHTKPRALNVKVRSL